MSNVEHPQHYQLSIDLEVFDVINLVLSNDFIKNEESFYLGNVLKYLFRADKKNGLEDYKKALYYFGKINSVNYCPKYTAVERTFIDKILEVVENEKTQEIIYYVIELDFFVAKKVLQEYIEEQEKQDEKL